MFSLAARNSGRYIFANIEVQLSLKSLKEAHVAVDRMEREIRQRVPFVEKVTVHYEPEAKDRLKYAVMLANSDGLISEYFGAAPLVALWDKRKSDGAVLYKEILNNPFETTEKGKGIRLAEFLADRKIDIIYSGENFTGKGPEYVFSSAEIEVREAIAANLDDLIARREQQSP